VFRFFLPLALFLAAGSSSLPAGPAGSNPGPVSPYYLTAGDQGLNFVIQGTSVAAFPQHHPEDSGEYAIVVTDTIRTLGSGNIALGRIPPHNGSEYTIADAYIAAGQYTGTDFPYPVTSAGFFDGATDGRFNYSVAFYGGGVYRFNADWSHPALLFATPEGYWGITWDPATNTLWLSDYWNNRLEHRTMNGAVLSSFPVAMNPAALALDPADGTLWLTAFQPQGRLFQYTRNGDSLGEISYPELWEQNTLGGEFAVPAVPAARGSAQGNGTIATAPGSSPGGSASFSFSQSLGAAKKKTKPSLTYSDPVAGLSFTTKTLGPVTITGRHAHFVGSAKLGKKGPTINFTVDVADLSTNGTNDQFSITLNTGYAAAGKLASGNILVSSQ
jgi:hypothetical protein